ncbi:MAG TPA: hypothetical protein VG325_00300 [Solirubrobacteraceae bacterium]|nr:hypothetical protein [Solirubrobacteraceae bacterium]
MADDSPRPMPQGGGVPVPAAVQARERGLWLVSRVNRWMIGLAVLLAGALAGLTAHAFHPKTASAQTATTAPSSQTPNAGGAGSAGPAPLQSPSSVPAPAVPSPAPGPVGPPVVSGGS